MRTPMTRVIVFLYLLAGVAPPAVAQVDQQRAQEYFKEARALCERDDGRLWGVSVCAPMVIVDRRTQTVATSQPPPEAARPRLLGLVNAPVQWGGATWGAYMWDDVDNRTPRDRKEFFLHELFHGVQPRLGLGVPALATEHLPRGKKKSNWVKRRGCGHADVEFGGNCPQHPGAACRPGQ